MPATTRLLDTFREVFEGHAYQHRNSTLGDRVAVMLYEDLRALRKSRNLVSRVKRQECVVNTGNKAVGKRSRRGDGTFGELVPAVAAITADGFVVARGPVANIQIGAETKILAKAMIKQLDRVISDLSNQVQQFKSTGGSPITVGLVGVNFAASYTSYEGGREYPTDGGARYRHPIQEAKEATRRLLTFAMPEFSEFLVLPFRATNIPPFPFAWVEPKTTRLEYSALLVRVSRLYDERFP